MKTKVKLTTQYLSRLPAEMVDDIEEELKNADVEPYILRKGFSGLEISEGEERVSIARMSTRGIDSDNEIVVPFALDITRFQKNPVLMFNHDWSAAPIGSVSNIKMDYFGIDGKLHFAETLMGNEIWSLVRDRHLRSNSIGFIITQYVTRSHPDFDKMIDHALKDWDEFTTQHADRLQGFITKGILLENSVVGIPANEDALMQAVAAKSMCLSDEMINLLHLDIDSDVEDGETVAVIDPTDDVESVEIITVEDVEDVEDVEESAEAPVEEDVVHEPKLVARLVRRAKPATAKRLDPQIIKRMAKDKIDLMCGRV